MSNPEYGAQPQQPQPQPQQYQQMPYGANAGAPGQYREVNKILYVLMCVSFSAAWAYTVFCVVKSVLVS